MNTYTKIQVTGAFEGLWYREHQGKVFPLAAEHDTGYIVNMTPGEDPATYALVLYEHAELVEG